MPPFQRVSLRELRDRFNSEILPRIEAGELLEVVRSSGNPNRAANQPPGTTSQRVEYFDAIEGELVLVDTVHRYLLPDGTLGASGLPDPKRIRVDGTVYAPHKPTPKG